MLGQCNTGSKQLHFLGTTKILCPGLMLVEVWRWWNFGFWVVNGEPYNLAGLLKGRGELVFCHTLIRVNTIWINCNQKCNTTVCRCEVEVKSHPLPTKKYLPKITYQTIFSNLYILVRLIINLVHFNIGKLHK